MSTCPECRNEMEAGYLYVRGLGGSLFWGRTKDARFYSRRDLMQIDLGKLIAIRPAAQAVLPAGKCSKCGMVSFKASP
jgi:Domain of unknown function (DUF6487)